MATTAKELENTSLQSLTVNIKFIEMTGDALSGIVLSQIYNWHQSSLNPDSAETWLPKSWNNLFNTLKLKRFRVSRILRQLESLGLITTKLAPKADSLVPILHISLNKNEVDKRLFAPAESFQQRVGKQHVGVGKQHLHVGKQHVEGPADDLKRVRHVDFTLVKGADNYNNVVKQVENETNTQSYSLVNTNTSNTKLLHDISGGGGMGEGGQHVQPVENEQTKIQPSTASLPNGFEVFEQTIFPGVKQVITNNNEVLPASDDLLFPDLMLNNEPKKAAMFSVQQERDSDYIFQAWRTAIEKYDPGAWPRTTNTPERKRLILQVLKNYTIPEVVEAIEGCLSNPWNIEHAKTDLSYIFQKKRIEEHIELARLSKKPKKMESKPWNRPKNADALDYIEQELQKERAKRGAL